MDDQSFLANDVTNELEGWFPNHFRLGRRGPSAEWVDYVAYRNVLQYEIDASLV